MPNASKTGSKEQTLPKQQQPEPGYEYKMDPPPVYLKPGYKGADKLLGKVAIVTGGDSGIGRATAVAFAHEGADIAVVFREEVVDAATTAREVEAAGRKCLVIQGDLGQESFCRNVVEKTVTELGRLDVLVNNAGEQHPQDSLDKISAEQLKRTFETNTFAMFYLTKAALPELKKNKGTIVNTTSVTAYRGAPTLLDYSSTKGAIVGFTRSLSGMLAKEGVRVNAVAPGPIWTPLIPSTFPPDKVKSFGSDVPLGRPGQPWECATAFVFLASGDSSYFTGQVLHPNGGEIVNA